MNDHQAIALTGKGEFLQVMIPADRLGFVPRQVWSPSPSRWHRTAPYELPQTIRIGLVPYDETASRFSPPPFAVVVEGDGHRTLVTVAAEAGWHLWNEMAFAVSEAGVEVRIDLEGQSDAGQVAEHVGVHLFAGQAEENRHDLLHRGLMVTYPQAQRERREVPDWWLRPSYCGCGDQVSTCMWLEGVGPEERHVAYCTQGLHERWIRRLEEAEVPFGTIIIDAGWSPGGRWEPDLNKWPDLRGFIDRQHEAGRKVLLWVATWLWEGLPDEWCVFAGDQKLTVDPTHPDYRAFIREQVHRLLSPAGFDADGFKVDQLHYAPSRRIPIGGAQFGRTVRMDPLAEPMRPAGEGWGCELLYRHQKDIYDAAKSAKPDSLVTSSTVHPYFYDTFDMVRLHDTSRIPEDIVAAMKARSDLSQAALPGMPIDADDWVHSDYQAWMTYTCQSYQLGVPCTFYAERFVNSREQEPATSEIPLADLRKIGEAWRHHYPPAREVSAKAPQAVSKGA